MPLHSPTVLTPRRHRIGRVAAVATVCMAAGAATVVNAADQPAPQVRTVADTTVTRYFDIEANKANSMRALGRHIVEQRTDRHLPYQDLEANKAHSRRAR